VVSGWTFTVGNYLKDAITSCEEAIAKPPDPIAKVKDAIA